MKSQSETEQPVVWRSRQVWLVIDLVERMLVFEVSQVLLVRGNTHQRGNRLWHNSGALQQVNVVYSLLCCLGFYHSPLLHLCLLHQQRLYLLQCRLFFYSYSSGSKVPVDSDQGKTIPLVVLVAQWQKHFLRLKLREILVPVGIVKMIGNQFSCRWCQLDHKD